MHILTLCREMQDGRLDASVCVGGRGGGVAMSLSIGQCFKHIYYVAGDHLITIIIIDYLWHPIP